MKKFLALMSVFTIVACGGGEKTTETTETVDDTSKKSRLLAEQLKNTSWAMPAYPPANITILDNTATISMSETSFLSNGTIDVLEDDSENNFVVFNVYTSNDNRVFAVSVIDPETIEVSIIQNSNSLAGYKDFHDRFKIQMKKK